MTNIERSRRNMPTGHTFRDPCALTPRELELLIVMREHGPGNYNDIALVLGLKRASISERFATIRQKLNVTTNEAAIEAVLGARAVGER